MTSLVVRDANQALTERGALLVEYDPAAISAGADPALVAKWAYSLPVEGGARAENVSARGAEEGVRLLSKYGEIIRAEPPVIANQDDREAYFLCTATRYVIGGDGMEIKLDSQTRGKRISKMERHSADWIKNHRGEPEEFFNKNWFEVGVAKVQRNAILALMPSNVKSALLQAGLDAARGGQRQQNRAPAQQSRPATAHQQATPEGDGVIEGSARQVDANPADGPITQAQLNTIKALVGTKWAPGQTLDQVAEHLRLDRPSLTSIDNLTEKQGADAIDWLKTDPWKAK